MNVASLAPPLLRGACSARCNPHRAEGGHRASGCESPRLSRLLFSAQQPFPSPARESTGTPPLTPPPGTLRRGILSPSGKEKPMNRHGSRQPCVRSQEGVSAPAKPVLAALFTCVRCHHRA
ncbi:hypothetical protein NDU88_005781 [Pleurodeles waltl]|uniref:Secreted protein n=1 Tax=Pleurodeles waltl TaxID=8319 RepID=A0AAV7WCE8_PLEWA|nr:hypothetical protein NDU88_005781 [Pleurodeles waltl]